MLHQFLDGEFEVAASLHMTESLQDVFSPAFFRPQGSKNGSIDFEDTGNAERPAGGACGAFGGGGRRTDA
jgi:hypothetical protein